MTIKDKLKEVAGDKTGEALGIIYDNIVGMFIVTWVAIVVVAALL